MSLEKEVFPHMAKEEELFAFDLKGWALLVIMCNVTFASNLLIRYYNK